MVTKEAWGLNAMGMLDEILRQKKYVHDLNTQQEVQEILASVLTSLPVYCLF